MNNSKRALAIDFGTKLIGTAVSDDSNMFSIPYKVIENNPRFFEKLVQIIVDENIGTIVIGYPKTYDNYVSQRHQLIDKFVNELNDKLTNIDIVLQDEAYTTKMSEYIQKDFGLKNSQIRKTKDMSSAALILDGFLKNNKNK